MGSRQVVSQECPSQVMSQEHRVRLALVEGVAKGKALVFIDVNAFIAILNLLNMGAGAGDLFVGGQVSVQVLQKGEVGRGAIVQLQHAGG